MNRRFPFLPFPDWRWALAPATGHGKENERYGKRGCIPALQGSQRLSGIRPRAAAGRDQAREDVVPVARHLPEQPHGRIPGTVVLIQQPWRQSGTFGNSTQTGARVLRRMRDGGVDGNHQIQVADHGCCIQERAGRPSRSLPRSCTGNRPPSCWSCSTPSPFCRLISDTPLPCSSGQRGSSRQRANGSNCRSGIERNGSQARLRFPCQQRPIFSPGMLAEFLPPAFPELRLRMQVGNVHGN